MKEENDNIIDDDFTHFGDLIVIYDNLIFIVKLSWSYLSLQIAGRYREIVLS